MALAQSTSPDSESQKRKDIGPSPFEQIGSDLSKAITNPDLKVARYTILPAVKRAPFIGPAVHFLEWAADPVGELKKSLNVSPTIGGAIAEAIVSNAVAGVARVSVAGAGKLADPTNQISTDLVQNAIAADLAQKATLAKRNPTKFLVQTAWRNLIHGDFLDRFIYEDRYIFHYDPKTGKAARWQANDLAESLNRYGAKYGVKIEGEELRFGAQAFNKIKVDRGHPLVTPLKFLKAGWNTTAPALITLGVAPQFAPFVLTWQALNVDWGQFITKRPVVTTPDPRLWDGRRKDAFGNMITDFSGQRYAWWQMRSRDKIFQTLDNFLTVRGLYRTLVTGETFREMGWKEEGRLSDNAVHFGPHAGQIDQRFQKAKSLELKRGPAGNFYVHRAFPHRGRIRLPDGRELLIGAVKTFDPRTGVAKTNLRRVIEVTGVNRFWQGTYYVQQLTSKVVAPAALAILLPNPLTVGLAAYMVIKNVGDVLEPLKWVGWNTVEFKNKVQLIGKFGRAGLTDAFLVLEVKGNSLFRRTVRRIYSIFSPFDRDVGILRGLIRWRDEHWAAAVKAFKNSTLGRRIRGPLAAILIKFPLLRRFLRFLSRTPIASFIFRAAGPLLGVLKWIVAPGDALKQFLANMAFKGVGWGIKKIWRSLVGGAPKIPLPQGLPGPKLSIGPRLAKLLRGLLRIGAKVIGLAWRIAKLLFNVVKEIVVTIRNIGALIAALPVIGPVILVIVIIAAIATILVGLIMLFFMVVAYFSLLGIQTGRFQSPPSSDYLEIRKEVSNPKPSGAFFVAGETIEYQISYTIKKPLDPPLIFQDYFLVKDKDSNGNDRFYFDENSINCNRPASVTGRRFENDPSGPSGTYYGIAANIPIADPSSGPVTTVFSCSAKVHPNYTSGILMNHAIIVGFKKGSQTKESTTVSQWLRLNGGGNATGWPVEHGCFTQGPNGSYSHQGQPAVDIGSNRSIGYNIDQQPVHATVDGAVVRICIDGTYNTNNLSGACGGLYDGSRFSTGFGTYVILKESNSNLSAFYAHLADVQASLSEGATVKKGDIVGYADNTGNSIGAHLHYAFTRNSGATMSPPYVPYFVPQCSGTFPDPTCDQAFANLGEPNKVCF